MTNPSKRHQCLCWRSHLQQVNPSQFNPGPANVVLKRQMISLIKKMQMKMCMKYLVLFYWRGLLSALIHDRGDEANGSTQIPSAQANSAFLVDFFFISKDRSPWEPAQLVYCRAAQHVFTSVNWLLWQHLTDVSPWSGYNLTACFPLEPFVLYLTWIQADQVVWAEDYFIMGNMFDIISSTHIMMPTMELLITNDQNYILFQKCCHTNRH